MNYWLDLSKNGLKTVKLVSFLFVNQLKLFYFSFIMALSLLSLEMYLASLQFLCQRVLPNVLYYGFWTTSLGMKLKALVDCAVGSQRHLGQGFVYAPLQN